MKKKKQKQVRRTVVERRPEGIYFSPAGYKNQTFQYAAIIYLEREWADRDGVVTMEERLRHGEPLYLHDCGVELAVIFRACLGLAGELERRMKEVDATKMEPVKEVKP